MQTKTLTFRAFGLSAATRRTSKKPNLCGLQPVARDPPNKHLLNGTPNRAGVDGDAGAFTPLPGWAVHVAYRRVVRNLPK
ncbi:hypothetical protein [Spirosoma arcticum]